ncbi:MAG: hypothetical protein ABIZ81_07215 [Opitutaceae bacterium]
MRDQAEARAANVSLGVGRLIEIIFVFGVFGLCLVRLAGFVHENAVDLLFNDQWDALDPLFEGRGPWSAFLRQHGPPRLGLGGLIDWYLYRATDWNVRAEGWAGVAALGLSTTTAIAMAARLRGRIRWSDAAFPLLLLSTAQWDTLTLTPFLAAKILPLLLTLLLAYAWSAERPVWRLVGVSIFGPLTLFTGYGFCGAPVTIGLALLLWLRAEKKKTPSDRLLATWTLLIMLGAVAVFAYGYQWSPGTKEWRFPLPNGWDYPRFCALMFTNLLGFRGISAASTAMGSLALGLVLTAFFMATIAIWRRQATARVRVVWILIGTTLVYATMTAIGRLPTSLAAAFMGRYTTLMMPALCGLAFAIEEWASSRGPKWRIGFGLAWLALAGVIWSNFTPETHAATVAKAKRRWVASYLETRDLEAANRTADFVVYIPAPTSPVIAQKLRWLEEHHLSFFRSSPDRK